MPTNNLEKWEERFDIRFKPSEIWEDAYNNHHSIVHTLKAFLRQEIRQAKIEAISDYGQKIKEGKICEVCGGEKEADLSSMCDKCLED